MRNLLLTLAFALSAMTGPAFALEQKGNADDPVVMVADADQAMNTAIATARSKLPRYWEIFAAKGGDEFGLKVGFPTSHNSLEHIWMSDIVREGNVIKGRVGNYPIDVPGLQIDQVVTIDPAWISDWYFQKGGTFYGHYTTKALIESMSADERKPYLGMLAAIKNDIP